MTINDKYAKENIVPFILNYTVDGSHHKQWVLDQVLRMILQDDYDKVIKDFENNGEYEWETGVAP